MIDVRFSIMYREQGLDDARIELINRTDGQLILTPGYDRAFVGPVYSVRGIRYAFEITLVGEDAADRSIEVTVLSSHAEVDYRQLGLEVDEFYDVSVYSRKVVGVDTGIRIYSIVSRVLFLIRVATGTITPPEVIWELTKNEAKGLAVELAVRLVVEIVERALPVDVVIFDNLCQRRFVYENITGDFTHESPGSGCAMDALILIRRMGDRP